MQRAIKLTLMSGQNPANENISTSLLRDEDQLDVKIRKKNDQTYVPGVQKLIDVGNNEVTEANARPYLHRAPLTTGRACS